MKLPAICFVLLLGGCMTSGTDVAPETAQAFRKGVTSYDEVVARLGEPQHVQTANDGAKTAIYTFSQTKVSPESFIPFVGTLIAKGETDVNSVTFRFDAKSRLVDYSTAKDRATVKMGG